MKDDMEFEMNPDVTELIEVNNNSTENMNSRSWSDLPTDLVRLLFPRLGLLDCLQVAGVCKSWALASDAISEAKVWPWLMYAPKYFTGIVNLFDPVSCTEYKREIKAISTNPSWLRFHSSRDGWVVISDIRHDSIFILNPITDEVINIPLLDVCYYHYMTFIGVPNCQDFRIFALRFYEDEFMIFSWYQGQEKWKKTSVKIESMFIPSMNSLVLFKKELYCLELRGQLGVFNPDKMTFRVLSKPEPIYPDEPFYYWGMRCALLELHGDLIAVFKVQRKGPIEVFKLDQAEMAWRKIEDMGDATLFVGPTNSLAASSLNGSIRNRLFLSNIDCEGRNKGLFYSMEDHKSDTLLYNADDPYAYTCVWFNPSTAITYKD